MVSTVDANAIGCFRQPLDDAQRTDALHMWTTMKHSRLDRPIDLNWDASCLGWPIDLMSPSAMDSCSVNLCCWLDFDAT